VTCPKCGSDEAVAKSVAWDAACEVPPQAQRQIARLEAVVQIANLICQDGAQDVNGPEPVIAVNADLLLRLQAAVAAMQPQGGGQTA
jgi:predicted RNA polymerase sigma factor